MARSTKKGAFVDAYLLARVEGMNSRNEKKVLRTWSRRSTVIPDVLSFEIEGVASRNRSGEPFYIDNTAHPAGRRLALARAKEMHMHGFGLDLDLVGKGNNGHFAPFSWAA